jgi:hypothetical protein
MFLGGLYPRKQIKVTKLRELWSLRKTKRRSWKLEKEDMIFARIH